MDHNDGNVRVTNKAMVSQRAAWLIQRGLSKAQRINTTACAVHATRELNCGGQPIIQRAAVHRSISRRSAKAASAIDEHKASDASRDERVRSTKRDLVRHTVLDCDRMVGCVSDLESDVRRRRWRCGTWWWQLWG